LRKAGNLDWAGMETGLISGRPGDQRVCAVLRRRKDPNQRSHPRVRDEDLGGRRSRGAACNRALIYGTAARLSATSLVGEGLVPSRQSSAVHDDLNGSSRGAPLQWRARRPPYRRETVFRKTLRRILSQVSPVFKQDNSRFQPRSFSNLFILVIPAFGTFQKP